MVYENKKALDKQEQSSYLASVGTIYGYAQIYRSSHSLQHQRKNILKKYPEAVIYADNFNEKTEWEALNKIITFEDVLVLYSVCQLDENIGKCIEKYIDLFYKRGIALCFIKEPHLNTSIFYGLKIGGSYKKEHEIFYTILRNQITLAYELNKVHKKEVGQNIKKGLENAKAEGKPLGGRIGSTYNIKKKDAAQEIILIYSKTFFGKSSDAFCIKKAGISRNTYYKYKRELQNTHKGYIMQDMRDKLTQGYTVAQLSKIHNLKKSYIKRIIKMAEAESSH